MRRQRKGRTATDRDSRRDFLRVATGNSESESVDNAKAGKTLTRPVPSPPDNPRPFKKPDIMARLKKTWGDRVFSVKEVDEMRAAEPEGEDG